MLLGVDAGGTSTRAVLVDDSGRCVGCGMAGGGNPVSWGPERATQQIVVAVTGALGAAGHSGSVDVAVMAMAGGSLFSTSDTLRQALLPLGVTGPIEFAPDLLATFCSGTAELDGYALVAGTGAAAVRVRDGRVDVSADGLGWLLGDEGSGFWIGHRTVTAALAALDGRGPATSLTDLVLAELGIADRTEADVSGRPAALQASVDLLYRWRPVELSRFAAVAFRAAGADGGDGGGVGSGSRALDAVAAGILQRARDLLVATVRAVRVDDVVGPVVVGGGVARRLPGLVEALLADEPASPPGGVRPVVTVTDGAVGAAVLALRRAGISVDGAVFDRLTASLAKLR